MTREEKDLLLKDLCARLPYYPKCEMIDELRVVNNEKDSSYTSTLFPKHIELFSYHNNFTIKPYLRPMSSMAEEEKIYIDHKWGADNFGDIITYSYCEGGVSEIELADIIGFQDWLNAHHFDYRGLIEKGLAVEAPEGMYND